MKKQRRLAGHLPRSATPVMRALAAAIAAACAAPAVAQNPPAGRELPIVCTAGACRGGVTNWVRPGADAATLGVNGRTMTINQARQRELYNWASFDVAEDHSVHFDQKFGASAVALNRVLGTTNPSSFINGKVTAPGEVYVVNQNGILFGGKSQVAVQSLVAATQDVWNDNEFLNGSLTDAIRKTDLQGQPAPQAALQGAVGTMGKVEVAAGAHLKSNEGGRVLLAAPEVRNAGLIETPGGQAVLAASHDRVFVTASTDSDLRGLVVEVDTGGKVENVGEIIAERGNVSLVGLAVNQNGVARATTAVSFNGSVRLAARHKAGPGTIVNNGGNVSITTAALSGTPAPGDPTQQFGVTLGSGSRTEVLPDLASPELSIDASVQRPSKVEIAGKDITLKPGAVVRATGGTVDLAGIPGATPSRITVESGAVIDVAGSQNVELPASRNVGEIELRGNELADVPLQRDGVLRGQKVQFDLRQVRFEENSPTTADDDQYFLPVGNVTAAVSSVRRGVGERTATGGTVRLTADSVDLQAGSLVDFSGGSVQYLPGFMPSTYLIAEGRAYSIETADPTIVYDAIRPSIDVDSARWGVTRTYNVFGDAFVAGRFDAGYVQGFDAGSLLIDSIDLSLDGELRGGTTRGVFQRDAATTRLGNRARFGHEIPLAGLLQIGRIDLQLQVPVGPSSIELGRSRRTEAALFVDEARLARSGLNRLELVSPGTITLGDLFLEAGGSLALTSGTGLVVDGQVQASGASVSLRTQQQPGLRPALTVKAGSRIDTQGGWVNDSAVLDAATAAAPRFINGGDVVLAAEGDLTLEAGSLIDVGAGALLGADGSLTAGKAGSIRLATAADEAEAVETRLMLAGELRGVGLEEGGSLTLTAPSFTLGTNALAQEVLLAPDFFRSGGFTSYTLNAESVQELSDSPLIRVATGSAISLDPEVLQLDQRMFSAPTGTDIDTFATRTRLPAAQRAATHLAFTTSRRLYELGDATASIVVERGASLATTLGGSIDFTAPDRIFVDGSLSAPAGHISLHLADVGDDVGFRQQGIWLGDGASLIATGGDRVVPNAEGLRTGDVLPGGTVSLHADRGYVITAPGSRIDVSGASATIDVLRDANPLRRAYGAQVIDTAAGRISLHASEGILPYGTLRGRGAGAAAGGDLSVALDLTARAGNGNFVGVASDQFPETARVLNLGSRRAWDATWLDFGDAGFVNALRSSGFLGDGSIRSTGGVNGVGLVDPAGIASGGFSSASFGARQNATEFRADGVSRYLRLPAEVRLSGDFSLALDRALSIDAPILGSNGGTAALSAAYVALGSSNEDFRVGTTESLNRFAATTGNGRLSVNADLIDLVGFSSLQGFGGAPVSLTSRGDLRLRGVALPPLSTNPENEFPEIAGALAAAGDLTLTAAQIYPTTLTRFDIELAGAGRTLQLAGNGAATSAPLSAGGRVSLEAARILQGGVLRAPLGSLALEGDSVELLAGSLTSVSGAGLTVPFGNLLLEDNWVLRINGVTRTLDEPRLFSSQPTPAELERRPFEDRDRPWQKEIAITGDDVRLNAGAVLDLSGGGDLLASEFLPGPGGSRDLLADTREFSFALLPTHGTAPAPVDPFLGADDVLASALSPDLPAVSLASLDLRITLGAGSGLPAGEYTVLPRGYAILPGAFLVTPVAASQDFTNSAAGVGPDGVPVVKGVFSVAGTGIAQQRPIAVRVEDRAQVAARAEYRIAGANAFFSERAATRGELTPQLPQDGGRLSLAATDSLRLQGRLAPNSGTGRNSLVDITAAELSIVNTLNPNATAVELLAGDLQGLGAESLLIGGTRTLTDDAMTLNIGAQRVTVQSGVTPSAPELMLAGTDRVIVNGSLLASGGEVSAIPINFAPNANGTPRPRAFARVSTGEQVTLTGDSAAGGIVEIGQTGSLFGAGSITLDGSSDVLVAGSLATNQGAIALSASRISVGAAPGGTAGLVLASFDALQARELKLVSASTIDFYGTLAASATPLSLLILDGDALRAMNAGGNAATSINASTLVLQNTGANNAVAPVAGGGSLLVVSDALQFGGGTLTLAGYDTTQVLAGTALATADTSLIVAGDATLFADAVRSANGAQLDFTVDGAFSLLARGAPVSPIEGTTRLSDATAALGGSFSLQANSVSIASQILMPAGSIALSAMAGDLTLLSGALLDVAGNIRAFDTHRVATGGGTVRLSATGQLGIAAGALVDVSGTLASGPDGRSEAAAAGTLVLAAAQGSLDVATGTLLGGLWQGGLGDRDSFVDPRATLALRASGARVQVDASALADQSMLLNEFATRGFSGAQNLRLRDGSLTIAGELVAHDIKLATDRGNLIVSGALDASGDAGGSIGLFAGQDLEVSGALFAQGLLNGATGGDIVLQSRDGSVSLLGGSTVDVAGRDGAGARRDSGQVRLVARRINGDTDLAIGALDGAVLGASRIEAVGNRVYTGVSRIDALETGDASQIGLDTLRSHTAQFMTNVAAMRARLDPSNAYAAALHLMPGVEVQSTAGTDLTLNTNWALNEWRDGGEAGVLTLRAGRELRLAGRLDDGIGRRDNLIALLNFAGDPNDFGQVDTLLDDASWRYQLVAGADLASLAASGAAAVAAARPLDVIRNAAADIVLNNSVVVRTGDGAITLAAGGDLRYLGNQAAIYTTGLNAGYGNLRYDPEEFDAVGAFLQDFLEIQLASGFNYGSVADTREDIATAPFFFDTYLPGIGFGRDGGDISINVAGDIVGPGSTQLFNDWLVVIGGETGEPILRAGTTNPTLPTLWGVRYDRFQQNLGTLGGGDVSINAGGNVSNLSVVLPTVARAISDDFTYRPLTQGFNLSGTAEVAVTGGGNLDMHVAGDVRGGSILLAQGSGSVRAGGEIAAATAQGVDGLYALGDAALALQAARDVRVEAVFNFTMLRRPALTAPGGVTMQDDTRAFFFTYGADSRFDATSYAGDLVLENRTRSSDPLFAQLAGNIGLTGDHEAAVRIYPGNARLSALGGDVVIEHNFQLFPTPSSQLEILAASDITDIGFDVGNAPVTIVQSDTDPALLPSVRTPVTASPLIRTNFEPGKQRPVNDAQRRWHAATPLHLGDRQPSLVIAGGSIGQARTESRGLRLFLAESGRIRAGDDVRNLDLEIQHNNADDASLVQAGRDLVFLPGRDLAGNFSQSIEDLFQGLLFTGGGRASVLAGRNIDLGTSDGIASVGNLRNFALADSGAGLEVFAGAGEGPDLAGFYERYVRAMTGSDRDAQLRELAGPTPSAEILAELDASMQALRSRIEAANIDPSVIRTDIDITSPLAALLLETFFDELLESGRAATSTGSNDYARGFAAIGSLFPADSYAGQLSSLLSRIHTEDGGDINLFVPGGGANAGAASTAAVTKAENQLGVVVQAAGDVRAFVRDDFLVNASRVFALQGGNIVMWASTGDIDAGRGAKGALAAPPPQVVFDPATGQFVTVFPPEVSGSGIRNFAPPGVVPGDVFLFAPQGVVSAGDAGIASAGNITIGATEVIGADNIDVGGTAVGVPTADVGLAAGLTGASDAASATSRGAADSANDRLGDEGPDENPFGQSTLSVISVEVLGFGG